MLHDTLHDKHTLLHAKYNCNIMYSMTTVFIHSRQWSLVRKLKILNSLESMQPD